MKERRCSGLGKKLKQREREKKKKIKGISFFFLNINSLLLKGINVLFHYMNLFICIVFFFFFLKKFPLD